MSASFRIKAVGVGATVALAACLLGGRPAASSQATQTAPMTGATPPNRPTPPTATPQASPGGASVPQATPATATTPPRPGAFNAGAARTQEDPAAVERGKTLYGLSCQACHGQDLRGGDMGGPNLLRSQVALSDQHGELITPIIHGARQAQGMPNIGLNDADALAVAAYVRSVIGTIKGQGTPPGELKALNIVVGDPHRGKAYFDQHCESCHATSGDFAHLADKYSEPKTLQARWLAGGRSTALDAPGNKTTVSVTTAPGQTVNGGLLHIDDFLVSLHLPDGTEQSFKRRGNVPEVVLHDPLQAHRDMLPQYTDSDIHDVTAYLVTLK